MLTEHGHLSLALWDTAGQEDYDRIRPLSYAGSDVVLLAFSVDNQTSLDNIVEKVPHSCFFICQWNPEIRHYCPNAPVLLVGLKTDLRTNVTSVGRLPSDSPSTIPKLKVSNFLNLF